MLLRAGIRRARLWLAEGLLADGSSACLPQSAPAFLPS